jgi:hypothetical protein
MFGKNSLKEKPPSIYWITGITTGNKSTMTASAMPDDLHEVGLSATFLGISIERVGNMKSKVETGTYRLDIVSCRWGIC